MNKLKHKINLTDYSKSFLSLLALCITYTLFTFVLLIPNFAQAAGWSINPTRIDLTPAKQTAAMTITNDSDTATTVQVQAVSWSQEEGKDVLIPTNELLVSPPIVTIAPKGVQIIRITLRKPADKAKELAYRINLQELPTATAQSTPQASSLQVALRIGLPVFVQPRKSIAEPKMIWKLETSPDSTLKVALHNTGNAHIQISDFSLFTPGSEQPLASVAGSSYVLAGESKEWLIKPTSISSEKVNTSGRLRLKAFTDGENIDTLLVLNKP